MYVSMDTFAKSVRLIERLSLLERSDQFAPTVLPALAEIVACDLITYAEIGNTTGVGYYREWPGGATAETTGGIVPHFPHTRPNVNRDRNQPDARPVMMGDFVAAARIHRLGRYGEFFARIPVEHQVSFTLVDAGPSMVGIALNRSRGPFDEQDRTVLAVLRGPLSRALGALRHRDRNRCIASERAGTDPGNDLSAQEMIVLRLVSDGLTNQAISDRLGVSPRTVAKHLEHIYRKLEVNNRAAAVARLGAERDPDHQRLAQPDVSGPIPAPGGAFR
jgi:DNA-binding CsgD family transcriptional regulator